ncbi:hypothetical protein [Metabacillus malikii]|uniref:Uncharacterized protein n=1 Tax=Metabacillus malikii TaxID=1504265 RepID=A0ABT9ZCY2_9BACI|nr:hypothetical protein [Metabacillus malikii]MDQ0230124.1 hypothetical protein [Metabacillus malikii]
MKLLNGVTGFYKANQPPNVDKKQFKRLCFNFVSQNGGKVIDFYKSQLTANFYCAQVEVLCTQLYILLNKHYPYLTFASSVEYGDIRFIDNVILTKEFAPFYKVISAGELNMPIHQNMLHGTALNDAELEQIAYWKPKTIGEIIFNYWD